MKILIITQKVDQTDTVLGFFHEWISSFTSVFSKVTVICLEKGSVNLPNEVKVYSLGKENGASKFQYVLNTLKLSWRHRKDYDAVFVHMNEEYVLVAGLLWKILGKKVSLWRNHPKGSWRTRIAVVLSDVVFCTSPHSFTARFKKAVRMPVGISMKLFEKKTGPQPRSLAYLGRISPIKNIHVFIDAIKLLPSGYTASIVGNAVSSRDEEYLKELREQAGSTSIPIVFRPGVAYSETSRVMTDHEILVNLTPDGSFDKILFETMAAETLLVTSNSALRDVMPPEYFSTAEPQAVAAAIETLSNMEEEKKQHFRQAMKKYVEENHSLDALVKKVATVLQSL